MTQHTSEPPKKDPSKSEPTKPLPLWYLFAACSGLGTSALEFFKFAPQKPVLAVAVGAGTMLGVAVFKPIGEQIQKWYVEQVTRTAEDVRKFGPGGFREHYLTHLRHRHRVFDVKGFSTQGPNSLELQKVFVDLRIVSQTPQKTSTDLLRAPSNLSTERRSIWDYLKSGKTEVPNLIIIGAPGSGKTTLLKHVALTLAADKKQRKTANVPDRLPILLFLRDHAAAINADGNYTLAQAVRDTLVRFQGPTAPTDWFEREITAGRCIVLLDGLDEVADAETRKKVVAWVETQMQAHGIHPFLITSRPGGYKDNPIAGVSVLEVLPFTREQQKTFIDNWYLANEAMTQQKEDEGVRLAAREGANDLLRRLKQNSTISELAVNPLLLTLIATVHRYRSSLPGRRVELYAEICEVFLGKRHAAKGLAEKLTPLQKQRVLEPLAYEMMCRNTRTLAFDDIFPILETPLKQVVMVRPTEDYKAILKTFLTDLEHGSGLILERETGFYGFAHLTFQEYLAAVYVQERRAELETELATRIRDTWWHETIRLYCSMAVDASAIVDACFDDSSGWTEIALGCECIDEAVSVQPKLRKKCDDLINQQAESTDPTIRKAAAMVLLTLRSRRMIRLDDDRYVDPGLISQVEYQLFLDQMRVEGKFYQPDHWTDITFQQGQGRWPVVGVRLSDAVAFCDWLTGLDPDRSEWRYRLPKPGELDNEPVQGDAPIGTFAGYWSKDEAGTHFVPVGEVAPQLTLGEIKQSHATEVAHDVTIALDRVLDRALALANALDLDQDLNPESEQGIAQAFDRAQDRNFDLALSLALVRARAVCLNLAHSRIVPRLCTLIISLVILKERKKGRLPAFEGIRVVREKIKEERREYKRETSAF
jgi:energy-coupling factor transporter ATP-binding protein EcfA2